MVRLVLVIISFQFGLWMFGSLALANASSALRNTKLLPSQVEVCKNAIGVIETVKSRDLVEGKQVHGLVPQLQLATLSENVAQLNLRLAQGRGPAFKAALQEKTSAILGLLHRSDETEEFETRTARNCSIVSLTQTSAQGQLSFSSVWRLMDSTNLAAAVGHEALRSIWQKYGARDEGRLRKAIAYATANQEFVSILDGLPENAWECHTVPSASGARWPGSHFYAYNTSTGNLVFQVNYLDGEPMLTKSLISVSQLDVGILDPEYNVGTGTYWLSLRSKMDRSMPVALGFGASFFGKKEMLIGIRQALENPDQKFECVKGWTPQGKFRNQ